MDLIKTIIQGRLEFGNQKSFDKVVKMYNYRAENYHKNDVLFSEEDIFVEEDLSMVIKRYVGQHIDKFFRNTVSLLDYCSQFAVAGEIGAWQTDAGKVLNYAFIEPHSDKGVVVNFLKGKKLALEPGKEEEALVALTKAIDKYDRHAQAYQRRAHVNLMLKKHHDAMRDYNKSIAIDDTIPFAYYGRAKIYFEKGEMENAIEDLETTLKKAIALQPIYWKARRLKSECHLILKQYDKVIFDLKLFTNRKFKEGDRNQNYKRRAWYNYGIALYETEDYLTAIKAFDESINLKEGNDNISLEDKLYHRGKAKYKAGKSGYMKDLREAKKMGHPLAQKMLDDIKEDKKN